MSGNSPDVFCAKLYNEALDVFPARTLTREPTETFKPVMFWNELS